MDVSREALIKRLLKDGKISQDEANLLKRKEVEYIPQPPVSPFPYVKKVYPQSTPNMDWIQKEMENRQNIADNCSCNPANGGSGVCGCILNSPIII